MSCAVLREKTQLSYLLVVGNQLGLDLACRAHLLVCLFWQKKSDEQGKKKSLEIGASPPPPGQHISVYSTSKMRVGWKQQQQQQHQMNKDWPITNRRWRRSPQKKKSIIHRYDVCIFLLFCSVSIPECPRWCRWYRCWQCRSSADQSRSNRRTSAARRIQTSCSVRCVWERFIRRQFSVTRARERVCVWVSECVCVLWIF